MIDHISNSRGRSKDSSPAVVTATQGDLETYRMAVKEAMQSVGLVPKPGRSNLSRSRVDIKSRRLVPKLNNLFEYKAVLKTGQQVVVICNLRSGKPIGIQVLFLTSIGSLSFNLGYRGLGPTIVTGCRQMHKQLLKPLMTGSGLKGRYKTEGTQVYVEARHPGLKTDLKLWIKKSTELAIALSNLRIKARAVM